MTRIPTALDAARRIAEGSLTCEALTRQCLERIAGREPAVQAWQHLDPDAALEAWIKDEVRQFKVAVEA